MLLNLAKGIREAQQQLQHADVDALDPEARDIFYSLLPALEGDQSGQPLPSAGSGLSLPRPRVFGDVEAKSWDQGTMRAWARQVTQWFRSAQGKFSFPGDLSAYFSGKPLVWVQQVINSAEISGLRDSELFASLLVRRFSGEIRDEQVVALDQLVKHDIVQGPDSVSVYSQRFLDVSRLCPSESQVSLCKHYIQGLKPVLRGLCCVNRDGDEWTSLSALIKFSANEERRQTLVNPKSSSAPLFPQGSGLKRQHSEIGTASVVVPGTSSVPGQQPSAWARVGQGSGSSGRGLFPASQSASRPAPAVPFSGQRRPFLEGEDLSRHPQRAQKWPKWLCPVGLPPVQSLEGFGFRGQPTQEQRRHLRDNWLCTVCKRARHPIQACPLSNLYDPNVQP